MNKGIFSRKILKIGFYILSIKSTVIAFCLYAVALRSPYICVINIGKDRVNSIQLMVIKEQNRTLSKNMNQKIFSKWTYLYWHER